MRFKAQSTRPFYLFLLSILIGCSGDDNHQLFNQGCKDSLFANVQSLDCPLADVTPYSPNTEFANRLADCAFNNSRLEACTLAELPLLGQITSTPLLEDVMGRVISDAPWMAENFKKALENNPAAQDIYQLSRAVTAIVLSSSIRPAHYNPATGAIYIDSGYLWGTKAEYDEISIDDDFRSGFGSDLQFRFLWRYTKESQYVLTGSNRAYNGDRNHAEPSVYLKLASLLYHELAHANDYFSQEMIAALGTSSDLTPLEAFQLNPIISRQLSLKSPLRSDIMKEVASIRWRGEEADDEAKAFTAVEVGESFSSDLAAHFYGYTTEREDLAMMFEMTMMRYRHNIQMDTVVSTKPDVEEPTGRDYLIDWGQRDRIIASSLNDRAIFVFEKLLPEAADKEFFDFLSVSGDPMLITPGLSWLSEELIKPDAKHLEWLSPLDLHQEFDPRHLID